MILPSRFADAKLAEMEALWRLSKAKAKDDWLKALAEWNKAHIEALEILSKLLVAAPDGFRKPRLKAALDDMRGANGCSYKMKIMSFASAPELRAWLAKNHGRSKGILLRIYKKQSGTVSVSYVEALDQALCYGWIDGQKLPGDKQSWLQTFTPRRPRSGWSKKNTGHAERLIKSGEMTAAGLKEIEAARSDGRWQAAYDILRRRLDT